MNTREDLLRQAEDLKAIANGMASTVTGNRHIVVLDRGWIFVGDLTEGDGGVCTLSRCKNIHRWTGGGFGGLTLSPKSVSAVMVDSGDVTFKQCIFMVPVPEDWDDK